MRPLRLGVKGDGVGLGGLVDSRPRLDSMYFFFDSVRSLTTDYGVELSIVSICDVLPASLKWRGGATLGFVCPCVRHARRLMPKAMRIRGVVPLAGKHNERGVCV